MSSGNCGAAELSLLQLLSPGRGLKHKPTKRARAGGAKEETCTSALRHGIGSAARA